MRHGSKCLSSAQLRELWSQCLCSELGRAEPEWVPPLPPCFNRNGKKLNSYLFSRSILQSVCVCHGVRLLGPKHQRCLVSFQKLLRLMGAGSVAEQGGLAETETGAKRLCVCENLFVYSLTT